MILSRNVQKFFNESHIVYDFAFWSCEYMASIYVLSNISFGRDVVKSFFFEGTDFRYESYTKITEISLDKTKGED